jgi:hypothetical protein
MKSRIIIWEGHVAHLGEREKIDAHVVLVGNNPERNRPLGRPRSRRDDNTKVDLKAIQKMRRI